MSVGLVIDTNVARSAGRPTPGASAPAPECVAVLEAIRTRAQSHQDVFIAMNDALFSEWFGILPSKPAHAGIYATKWFAAMVSSGHVQNVPQDGLLISDFQAVVAAVGKNVGVPLAKDEHIVTLALQTGKRLVTNEVKLLNNLQIAAIYWVELGKIHYARPEDLLTVPWLLLGSPDSLAFQVCP